MPLIKRGAPDLKSASKRRKLCFDQRIPKPAVRIVQARLDSILKEPLLKPKIFQICLNMHKLASLSYQFTALYLTKLLEDHQPLPKIDQKWFIEVIRCVAYSTTLGKTQRAKKFRAPSQATEAQRLKKQAQDATILQGRAGIHQFMAKHFQQHVPKNDPIDFESLSNQMNYLATEMNTALSNNISEHYENYLETFIRTLDPELESVGRFLRTIKHQTPLDLPPDHALHRHVTHLTPVELEKNSVDYDINVDPYRYLPCMFYMLQFLEERKAKMYQLFPLRTEIIPKSVRIDTICLSRRLRCDDQLGKLRVVETIDKPKLWQHYFKTETKPFGTGDSYQFDYSIITDGVSCSIQQRLRPDHPQFIGVEGKTGDSCPYVTDIKPSQLANRSVVGIDPGVHDLIYCSRTKDTGSRKYSVDTFHYSSRQRSHEMGTKKSNARRKQAIDSEPKIRGKTVEQWQHELSFEKKKTTHYDTLLKYVKKKIELNGALLGFWSAEQFRIMKWQAKVNKRRSEDRMVQRFKEKFGPPDKVLLAMGDWSRGRNLKMGAPSKGKSFRTLFKRFGYDMVLVNEFRTSKMCYNCGSETNNPRRLLHSKPKRVQGCPFDEPCDGCVKRQAESKAEPKQRTNSNNSLIHGLLVCKTCNTFWNRDLNGSLNIGLVAKEHLQGRDRPTYLKRKVLDPIQNSPS